MRNLVFGVGFDDTFKADNYILSIVLRANQRVGWKKKKGKVGNFINPFGSFT